MRNHEVPDDGLKGFGVWGDRIGGDGRHDDACVGDLSGVAAIAPDDADDLRALLLCESQRLDEVGADIFFDIAAAHREDKHRVAFAQMAAGEPARVACVPAIVVDACGQFADVVGGGVALDAGDLTEIVNSVAGMAGAPADSKKEHAAVFFTGFAENVDHFINLFLVESGSDFTDFSEVFGGVLAQELCDALNGEAATIVPEQPLYWRVPDAEKTMELPPLALLAGGLATRLRPMTATIPKSMIEVAGEPFIAHQLRLLAGLGVVNVVVCAGYLGHLVENYVENGARFGCRVRYSYDGETLLGTGGAVERALPMLGPEFFVMYGDSYLRADLREMYAAFRAAGRAAMMGVFRNQGKWDESNVEFAGGMVQVYDKNLRSEAMQYIDYGVGLLTAGLFEGRSGAFDLAEVYREAVRHGELAGWEARERFYEIGSPAGLAELNALLEKGRAI